MSDDRIQCLECGKWFHKIAERHLKKCCGLTTKEYREKYPDALLVSGYYKDSLSKCMKGIVFTEEHKQNLKGPRPQISGENNPMWGKRGELSPLFGREYTDEHCKNISNALKGNENLKTGKNRTGDLNPMFGLHGEDNPNFGSKRTDEQKKNITDSLKGKYIGDNNWNTGVKRTEEQRENIRIAAVNRCMNNPDSLYVRGNRGHFYSHKNQKEIYYQSSYELKAMEIMEQNNEIVSYDRANVYIPYLNKNNSKRYYIPDFLIVFGGGVIKLIEIKPVEFLDKFENPKKFSAALEYAEKNNIVYEIWTQKELNIK